MPSYTTFDCVHILDGPNVTAQVGYSAATAVTFTSLQGGANRSQIPFERHVVPRMTAEWSLRETRIVTPVGDFTVPGTKQGESAPRAMLNNTSVLVSKIPIQGHAGRMYVPGFTQAGVIASGALASTFRMNIQQSFDDYLEQLDALLINMVMNRPDGTNDLVTSLKVGRSVGRQDRRLVRSRK